MRIIAVVLSLMFFATIGYALDIQEEFDHIGPVVKYFESSTGKTLVYIDEGEPDWKPVLFLGGTGTSVRVFGMTEFARTLRKKLKLRVISLERDGFGETEYTAGPDGKEWQYDDYANEVVELLDYLGVDKFRGIAISGGGPYLGVIATRMPERIVSLHFAAAGSFYGSGYMCQYFDWDYMSGIFRSSATNPIAWWNFGDDAVVNAVPGLKDVAHDDSARTFFIRGQFTDDINGVLPVETPEVAEYQRYYCTDTTEYDLSGIEAPVYLYYGTADSLYPDHYDYWEGNFPNVVKSRIYENEGHDVQYRHWDQILVDMAGMGNRIVICHNGKSKLLPQRKAQRFIARGATLGICGWSQENDD